MQNQKLPKVKKILLNNWSLKLIAVLVACIMWLVVMYNLNPMDTKTITVSINILNGDSLTSQNWVYECVGSLETEVTVEAHSFDLAKIDASDFNLYVDMRYPTGGTTDQKRYQISKEVVSNEDLIEKYTLKDDYLDFTFEEIVTREFAVNVITSGKAAENFTAAEKPTSVPESVTVTGRSSEVDQIAKVVFYLDINDASEEINQTGKPKLLDEDDNELTELTSVTVSPETVQVCQPIYQTKNVVVSCTSVTGEPATGYGLAGIELDVETVEVSGYKAVLSEFVTLDIPSDLISIDGLTASKTFAVNLEELELPDGVSLSGNTKVNVTVKIEKLKQNNFRLALPDDVSMEGKSDEFEYSFVNNVVFVTVEGISTDIDNMESSNIAATLDMSGCTQEGVYSLPLDVKLPDGITMVGEVEVEVTVSLHQDETETVTVPPTTTATTTAQPTTTEPSQTAPEETTVETTTETEAPTTEVIATESQTEQSGEVQTEETGTEEETKADAGNETTESGE